MQQPVAQGHEDDHRDELQQMAQSLLNQHLEIDEMLTQMLARGFTIEQRHQLITKYADIINRLEAQIRALAGDPVWEYVQALESTDPSIMNKVMNKYSYNDTAMAAMSATHKIFDSSESFVNQLKRLRETRLGV